MKKTIVKALSIILAVILTLTAAPLSGFIGIDLPEVLDFSIMSKAAETSGTCGENVTWTFDDSTSTLTISGTGNMNDYSWSNRPWESYEDNIKEVIIENGVTTIGEYAFYSCDSLISVTIPDSVTTIGDDAFAYCESLTRVSIGKSVTSISVYAFSGCISLTSMVVDSDNQYYSNDEYGVLFNKDKTTLIQYPIGNTRTSYTIPDSVTTIGNFAFTGCTSLTSLTIPDSVTTIGDDVFAYCDSLTSVTISDGVTTIGDWMFAYCDSLTSVIIPDSVTSIGHSAFSNCTSLEGITIPDSVTTIGYGVFSSCDSLESVTLGDSVITIGNFAFYNCTSLTSVTLGDSVTTIGEEAFAYCDSLTSVTISDSVTTIGPRVFAYCDSLTSIKLSDSVTTIGYYAFESCDSLTSVHITDISAWCNIDFGYSYSNPLTYADNLYLNGEKVTDLLIPDSVTSIGNGAFCSYDSLTSVTIPDSVTTIGAYAFRDCTHLKSITIPDSVTTIGHYAFRDCTSLTSIIIPDSVTSISNGAFSGTAYYNDSSNWEDDVLYIDNHLIKAKADISGDYEIKEDTLTISGSSFDSCANLTNIVIPDSVTTIGSGAFSYCDSLTSVTFSDSLTTIGDSAFSYCKSLTSVTLPDSVTTIGGYAFCGCTSLTNITIPDSVTSIGCLAFLDCTNLTDVYFTGSEDEWKNISIDEYNYELLYANIHFNYCPHEYTSFVTELTCTNDGYTTYTCSLCGDSYTDNLIKATGHNYNSVVTAPTCTEKGYTTYTCLTCGDTYISDETATIEHNFIDDVCTVCGVVDTIPRIVVSQKTPAYTRKQVDVAISLKNNPGIISMLLQVSYDTSKLELVKVTDCKKLGASFHSNSYKSPYTLSWANDTAIENYTYNGEVVILTFNVLEDAEIGETEITVTYSNKKYDIMDKDLNLVDFEVTNGTVDIMAAIFGDVNNDCTVNSLDRVYLTRYLAYWDGYSADKINMVGADVNNDGKVNQLDRTILTRHIANWEGYEALPYAK